MAPGAEGHRKDTGGSRSFNIRSSMLLNRTIKILGTMLLVIAVCTSCADDVASDLKAVPILTLRGFGEIGFRRLSRTARGHR